MKAELRLEEDEEGEDWSAWAVPKKLHSLHRNIQHIKEYKERPCVRGFNDLSWYTTDFEQKNMTFSASGQDKKIRNTP